jgi:DNA-binding response OmpR family regulator
LKLEEATGYELAHDARRGLSNLNRLTPIIALNAGATGGRVAVARDLGVSEFVCKPLSRKAFVDRVNVALHNPRNFIKANDFFGPDRRRRSGGFDGQDRRRQRPRRVLIADALPGVEV